MIETLAFRTQARTIDHLGREQIADCPTAITELWKNAYDAYARKASLHIFDDEEPVAAIYDDGHGMSYDEFVDRWLVVGTESKYDAQAPKTEDRNGLKIRTKQGQKGIGRLSSANLGPLLLVVSKRKNNDFVAALLDWRIFENPYLILSDIEIPVTSFKQQDELWDLLPQMFERLTENVWGTDRAPERKLRLEAAWNAFDGLSSPKKNLPPKPSEAIVSTLIDARFAPKHLDDWAVWSGESEQGTAMLVSEINFDLKAQLPSIEPDGILNDIRTRFFATLSAFTDPLIDSEVPEVNAQDPHFEYEVRIVSEVGSKSIIGEDQSYNRGLIDDMEHVLEGTIDELGVFRGRIKAFGEWKELGSDYIIRPPRDFKPPKGPNTLLGPVSLCLATYEREPISSSHSGDDHSRLGELSKKYGGVLVFRNGLRVLPYGRVDNDFFEIEQRRNRHAGREFWNAQRTFGRLAISREQNPNLRDKAGREGFIDNRATKALKALVIHILKTSARDYFGTASELRKPAIAEIEAVNLAEKTEQHRKEVSKKNRKKFQTQLKRNIPLISVLRSTVVKVQEEFSATSVAEIVKNQEIISTHREALANLKIAGAPRPLGIAEEDYRMFRIVYEECEEVLGKINDALDVSIAKIDPPEPEDILEKQLQSYAGQIHARTRAWRSAIDTLQAGEKQRIDELFTDRNKFFHTRALPILDRLKGKEIRLNYALRKLEEVRSEVDEGNEELFEAYIAALTLLKENIDVELLVSQGMYDNNELNDQLNRLNQLAQLGITVEILGHELNSYDQMISSGLRRLKSGKNSKSATEAIRTGYEGLSRHLEFLSPLKLSGQRTSRTISGDEIFQYLEDFFENVFSNRSIKLEATPEFRSMSLHEQPSRLFPVFINLVNNSIYWMITSRAENPTLKLSVVGGKVVISDNGPGVESLDIPHLFEMFFSRKVSGGRGIGLYLSRVNLLAGGHHIEYVTDEEFEVLPGANFVIEFRGLSFV